MKQQREILLLVHCHDLPGVRFEERTGVRLGIQKGRDVIDDVPAEGDGLVFMATLRVGGPKTGKPNFLGPYAHGAPEGRFLYLCWGERKSGEWDPLRRAKVPLSHVDWERLERAWETGSPLTLSVAMTDSRGGPACGSVDVD